MSNDIPVDILTARLNLEASIAFL